MSSRPDPTMFCAFDEVNNDTRWHLWNSASLLTDELRMELDEAGGTPPWEVDEAVFGFSECLPPGLRSQYTNQTALHFLEALNAVIWKLGNGPLGEAMLSTTMEELAMRAILRRAADGLEEAAETQAEAGRYEPANVDLDPLYDLVFQDLDHEMLFVAALDGIETDTETLTAMGIGDVLQPARWLDPFESAPDKGHPLSWEYSQD